MQTHVIGVGATGSRVALSLIQMRQALTIYDFDSVEEKNLQNQVYRMPDIGLPKVEAMSAIGKSMDWPIISHNMRVESCKDMSGVIFCLTDTMKSRKELWNSVNPFTCTMWIETRLGVDQCRVYCIDPSDSQQAQEYAKTLYSDDVGVERTACGTIAPALLSTAEICAGFAVSAFNRFMAGNKAENELLLWSDPPTVMTRSFNPSL